MANETISGCRSVALHCALKFAKKTNEVKQCFVYLAKRYFSKRCFAFFEKVLCVFRFVISILSLERITLKLLTNKYSFILSKRLNVSFSSVS